MRFRHFHDSNAYNHTKTKRCCSIFLTRPRRLEKLYVFGRVLLRKLPASLERLPLEIQQNIDIESYRIKQTSKGSISLPRGEKELNPIGPKEIYTLGHDELEPLSQILRDLNEHF